MTLQIGTTDTVEAGDFYTNPVTVLTQVPSAAAAKRVRVAVDVGDAVNGLDTDGGQLIFDVTVGEQFAGSFEFMIPAGETRIHWESGIFTVPADEEIVVECQSSNPLDTSVNSEGICWSAEEVDMIGVAGAINVIAPISIDGDLMTLITDDDYTEESGQPLQFSDSSDTWPDLSQPGTVLALHIRKVSNDNLILRVFGTYVAGGDHQVAQFEITHDQMHKVYAQAAGTAKYDVQAKIDDGLNVYYRTLVMGDCTIVNVPHRW